MTTQSLLIAKIVTEGVSKATDEFKKFSKASDNADSSSNKLAAGIGKVAARATMVVGPLLLVGKALYEITQFATEQAHAFDDTNDAAFRLGKTYEEFKTLETVFGSVGVSAEQASKMMLKTETAMATLADTGKGKVAKALEQLGDRVDLSRDSFVGLSGEEGIQLLVNQMEKSNVSFAEQVQLLDKIQPGLSKTLSLYQNNGEAMKELAESQEEINDAFRLSDAQKENLEDLDKASTRLSEAFKALKTETAAILAPIGTLFTDLAADFILFTGAVTESDLEAAKAAEAAAEAKKEQVNIDNVAAEKKKIATKEEADRLKELTKEEEKRVKAQKSADEAKLARLAVLRDAFETTFQNVQAYYEKEMKLSQLQFEFALSSGKKGVLASKEFYDTVYKYKVAAVDQIIEADKKAFQSAKDYAAKTSKQQKLIDSEWKEQKEVSSINANKAVEKNITSLINSEIDYYSERSRLDKDYSKQAEAELMKRTQNKIDIQAAELARGGDPVEFVGPQRLQHEKELLEKEAGMVAQFQLEAVVKDKQTRDEILNIGKTQYEQDLSNLNTYQLEKWAAIQKAANDEIITETEKNAALEALAQESATKVADIRRAEYTQGLSDLESFSASVHNFMQDAEVGAKKDRRNAFYVQKAFQLAIGGLQLSGAIAKAANSADNVTTLQQFTNMAAVAAAVGNVIGTIGSANYKERAQGGQFGKGTYMVGEKGPEMVQFGSGGRIANNQDTNRLMNGNGGTNITIVNQTSGRIDKTETRQMDDGRVMIIVKEMLQNEVLQPNSAFNKNFDKTRSTQRRLS